MLPESRINKGVAKTGKSIGDQDPIFLFPLVTALLLMLAFVFTYLIKLIKKRYTTIQDKIVRIGATITSIIGLVLFGCLVMAILKVSEQKLFHSGIWSSGNLQLYISDGAGIFYVPDFNLGVLYLNHKKNRCEKCRFLRDFFKHTISNLSVLLGNHITYINEQV
ncbi:hypothetical protein C8C82_4208 [Flavobacterium sp. 81]|uniref:hypothetical protein n=1 Tax=Flavobacterium sp. 81 TaxID=2135621 RepID=UPI000EB42002|nr:hypothetical protein [Flavobacterium sp. 81]RKR04553.1 hypothetical protein C8C82_4208 [Flavobacterium sp. 81]